MGKRLSENLEDLHDESGIGKYLVGKYQTKYAEYYGERNWQKVNGKKEFLIEVSDLNSAFLPDEGDDIAWLTHDYGTVGSDGKTLVFFKDLENHLIHFIQEADVVLGCVAWLTSEPILRAFAAKRGVSIIVQKEDFLRPDFRPNNDWSCGLRQLYRALPKGIDARNLSRILTVLTKPQSGDHAVLIEPVRCVGNYNVDRQPACPRSHHKFVIFCHAKENCTCQGCQSRREYFEEYEKPYCRCPSCLTYEKSMLHVEPYAVWTGSYNFTRNAAMSFENALVLYDEKIVYAYCSEYAQIAAISEPLNWTKAWVDPEWRIRTWS
jgi:hypothetical protein